MVAREVVLFKIILRVCRLLIDKWMGEQVDE